MKIHPFASSLLALGLLLSGTHTIAATTPTLTHKPATVRLGIEQITLPGDEKMGMLGSSYLLEITPKLYFGPAVYGAISGQRGGFYTIGGEVLWAQPIGSKLNLETGVYVGGGGGGAAPVGGGLMLRPHMDLLWKFDGYRLGVSASHVRFPNGEINSNQLGLIADFDTQFRFTDFASCGTKAPISERSGVGFDRVLVVIGAYHPSKSSRNVSQQSLDQRIGLVGARMEQLFTPNYYWGIETNGAASGGVAGYAEFLGTLGAEMPVGEHFKVGGRVALGMGGGGTIDVGGGLLVKTGISAEAILSKDAAIGLEAGIAHSPDGNFHANYAGATLNWSLDHPFNNASESRLVGNEWIAGVQRYISAARRNGESKAMDSVTLKLNRFISNSFYLSGQAHSAFDGEAGGYSVGLVGLGYRTAKSDSGLLAGAELLAGAGAGGGVDSGGGALVQPMVYVGYDISKALSARLNVGKIKSVGGALDSTVVDLGLSFEFGTGRRK